MICHKIMYFCLSKFSDFIVFKHISSRLPLIILLLCSMQGYAQPAVTVEGNVRAAPSGEPLAGVNVSIKDKFIGTFTDLNGDFSIETQTPFPFTLVLSIVGYETSELLIDDSNTKIAVELSEKVIFGEEVVVSASRVEERIVSSPVSIEKMGILDIQQNSSANFYDGLYQMKGVDMNVNSLTFRFPNTRGFTGEANYRMNQLVDGIENISPGLSFAAGNMFGTSELDVESVELLVGASSALYGPGGMNGTLLMTSKDPFDYQGLSATAQVGMMHLGAAYDQVAAPMVDFSFRYAKAFHNKFAFKLTGGYLQATDWHASDFRDRTDLNDPTLTRETNPGYDGVNVYGDDIIAPVNINSAVPPVVEGLAAALGITPGTPAYDALYSQVDNLFPSQVVSRTGWEEKDIGDYNTNNLKLGAAAHYRINDKLEAVIQGNYNKGTSLYTTTNRFSIREFEIGYGKLELKSPNFFIRSWAVIEDAGNSYDLGGAALLINESWKSSDLWYRDYFDAYTQRVFSGASAEDAHKLARESADNRDESGNIIEESLPALPLPGTPQFDALLNDISRRSVTEGGAKITDQSQLWHTEGMYNLSDMLDFADVVVGASYRHYWINSMGTVFADAPGKPITFYIIGAYTQISKDFWSERIRASFSARYDKHENFEGQFTPRLSMVFAVDRQKQHHLRMSYQSAFRFPSTADQWTDFNAGYYRAIGGLPQMHQKYGLDVGPVYPLSGNNPITDVPVVDDGPYDIPTFRPEKVTAMEFGYKGLGFDKKVFLDAYIYHNEYDGFIANQLLALNPFTPEQQVFQTAISSEDRVSSYGWAIGADINLGKGFYARGNVAYNKLIDNASDQGRQTRFNTPDYRFNIGAGNRSIFKNIGMHLNYRWQNDFIWESNFGVAQIPAFGTLDANVAVKIPALKSLVKIGGSNILNQYYVTSFGSSQIGGLYYLSITFDEVLN
jgi:iron complex outermembrane receptor protein